jgi:hypothetical protein
MMTVLLAALWPATVMAEPTTSDVARDVADLAGRVDDLELLRNVVLGLLGASALGLPALWWRLGKRISRVADEQISSLLESRPGALLTLVAEHDREVKLRRESRIVIVSDGLDLETVLRQHGFFKVVSRPPDAELGALGEAAAVVFDLRTLAEETAASLMRQHGLDHVLAYTTGRAALPKATFANSPITLFARLCELLKFEAAREKG